MQRVDVYIGHPEFELNLQTDETWQKKQKQNHRVIINCIALDIICISMDRNPFPRYQFSATSKVVK